MNTIENKTTTTQQEGKNIAIIAYITIIGLIVAFVMNNDKNSYASYHIRQSLGLAVLGLALGVIGMIPIIGWIINFFGLFVLIYMWVIGLINAINNHEKPVPFLGTKFIEWFKNI